MVRIFELVRVAVGLRLEKWGGGELSQETVYTLTDIRDFPQSSDNFLK
jgi:hypothetical protein